MWNEPPGFRDEMMMLTPEEYADRLNQLRVMLQVADPALYNDVLSEIESTSACCMHHYEPVLSGGRWFCSVCYRALQAGQLVFRTQHHDQYKLIEQKYSGDILIIEHKLASAPGRKVVAESWKGTAEADPPIWPFRMEL